MRGLVAALSIGVISTLAIPSSPGVCQPASTRSFTFPPAVTPGLSAHVVYNNLTLPRAMRWDSQQNLLVIERYVGITALTPRRDATCVGWEKRVVLLKDDLHHGIEVHNGRGGNQYLYASSTENVYRWEYDPRTATVIGNYTIIAWNMTNVNPIQPDHITRTLLVQPDARGIPKYLIVTRGATGNWDPTAANPNSGPAQIRRFDLSKVPPGTGYAWAQGEILGWGLRNAVGIALSMDGKDLWEVENSSDNVEWRGIDVHNDNPAEELNRIPLSPNPTSIARKYYGYPSCFTVWNPSSFQNASIPNPGFKVGDQFSVKPPPATPDDAWCANPTNNVRPELAFQSHSAPLDIVIYNNEKCTPRINPYGLSGQWDGDAFVGFHGSWNRDPPTGYKVVRVPFRNGRPVAKPSSGTGYETVVGAPNTAACPDGCIRPVGLLFDNLGRLFVTSDTTGEVSTMNPGLADEIY
ncbi:soluble quino protein glucose dehydrogenase [Ceratobasidium sp. AG-I]|nr:soluble quino protein glucose dehydrogenase [Ceratobasidium sp. AG-I]